MVCAYQTYSSLNNGCSCTSSSAHLATWGDEKKAAINTCAHQSVAGRLFVQRPLLEISVFTPTSGNLRHEIWIEHIIDHFLPSPCAAVFSNLSSFVANLSSPVPQMVCEVFPSLNGPSKSSLLMLLWGGGHLKTTGLSTDQLMTILKYG